MNKLIYWLMLFGLIVIGVCSCTTAKQLKRAEQRVLANRESVERVGREWSKLHPCVPDSVVRIIPGVPEIKREFITDTVTSIIRDTVYQVVTNTITKTERIRDTVEIVKRDNREIDLLKSDLEKERANNAAYQIKIAEQAAEIEKQTSRKNKWFWLWIVTVVAFAGWIFRKPILSLITKIPL